MPPTTDIKISITIFIIEQIVSYKMIFFKTVLIIQLAHMSWLRSSFCCLEAVHGYPEHGLFIHTVVTTAETHFLLCCAQIYFLVSVKFKQASTNVNVCHFFCFEQALGTSTITTLWPIKLVFILNTTTYIWPHIFTKTYKKNKKPPVYQYFYFCGSCLSSCLVILICVLFIYSLIFS